MNKLISAISTGLAAVLISVSPALAGLNSGVGSFLIADIGRDTISMSKSSDTLPKIVSAMPAEFPQMEHELGYDTTAIVKVDLTSVGKVARVGIWKTSGNAVLDRNALYAVANATYAPGTIAGMPVGGVYAVSVPFDSEK